MIAKPLGFTATAAPTFFYLHHDKGGRLTQERVLWAENVNCVDASPEETEAMWAQLVADAPELKRQAGGSGRGRRLEKPYGQYLFSWHPDENPSRKHILDTVKDGMTRLGYGRCEYRVIVHRDKDHIHAHVVVCRVYRESGCARGRKNDGEQLMKWSLEYEKGQGRIRVKGRLDDLTHRQRHIRQLRNGEKPTPATAERNRRRRERRRRRRTTRDALGRPIVLSEHERQQWAALLRTNPSQRETAALKREQTAARLKEAHQRLDRLGAAAPKPRSKDVIEPEPERLRQDLAVEVNTVQPPPRPKDVIEPEPERLRQDLAVQVDTVQPPPRPKDVIEPEPERLRQDLAVQVDTVQPPPRPKDVIEPEPERLREEPAREPKPEPVQPGPIVVRGGRRPAGPPKPATLRGGLLSIPGAKRPPHTDRGGPDRGGRG